MELLSGTYERFSPAICTHIVFTALFPLALGTVLLTCSSIRSWCQEFRYRKYERWHEKCPSNSQKPLERPADEEQNALLSAARAKRPSIVDDIASKPNVPRESPKLQSRGRACPVVLPEGRSGPVHLSSRIHSNSISDMDHIRVGFWDYLWASFFVGPNSVFLWITGILGLKVRQALHRRGWLSPKPCDPRSVVGRLVLESTEVMQFTCEREEKGEKIATFCWLDFPMLDNDGSFKVADLFTVDINLKTKSMTMAKIDEKYLTPEETMILIWFHACFVNHVKVHAYANWGVNDSIPNNFVHRMSVVTAVYNYYGYTVFKRLVDCWYSLGLCSQSFCNITKVMNHSLKEGIRCHSQLRKLMRYSELVDFVIKVRNGFMNAFCRYRDQLHGIDGEAMFIGTILHSLDHTLMEGSLADPLWLDTDSQEFGAMAELGRFARVGVLSDLPGLLFTKSYMNAPHPFYQEVYRHAARVNKHLADRMDACIAK